MITSSVTYIVFVPSGALKYFLKAASCASVKSEPRANMSPGL